MNDYGQRIPAKTSSTVDGIARQTMTTDGIARQTMTVDDFSIEVYLRQEISAFYDAIIRSENQRVEDSIMFGDSSEEIPMDVIEIPINDSDWRLNNLWISPSRQRRTTCEIHKLSEKMNENDDT